ncbi:MAG: hypothetical protein WCE54_01560 [Ignavibacteriaceae bacterium]
MQVEVQKVKEDLARHGFTPDQAQKVQEVIIANMKPETLDKAVVFLGLATLALIVGGILLAGLGREVPDPLWSVLGAGIGGLAGVFMGRK